MNTYERVHEHVNVHERSFTFVYLSRGLYTLRSRTWPVHERSFTFVYMPGGCEHRPLRLPRGGPMFKRKADPRTAVAHGAHAECTEGHTQHAKECCPHLLPRILRRSFRVRDSIPLASCVPQEVLLAPRPRKRRAGGAGAHLASAAAGEATPVPRSAGGTPRC